MSNEITHVVTPMVQEDTRAIEAVKRVRKMFDEVAESINAMALKRHQCKDPDLCTKPICFIHEPDIIVNTEIVDRKTEEQRTEELKQRRLNNHQDK